MVVERRAEIGRRLRDCRKAARLSQEDVAAELAVSAKAVSSWEGGERMPSAERFGELCAIYGVSADFILFGTDMVPRELLELLARAACR